MSEAKVVLSVRVDPKLLERLARLEERTGLSRAEVVERCLWVGMVDEEEFVGWFESPLKGPLMQVLTSRPVLNALFKLSGGGTIDETQQRVRENVSKRRRVGKRAGKLAPGGGRS